jgi:hypothetical protein
MRAFLLKKSFKKMMKQKSKDEKSKVVHFRFGKAQ